MELSLLDVCLVDTAKEFMMLKKLILSAATAASLVLGAGVMTAAPAQAQVHFGFGDGYGWQRHRHWRGPHQVRCEVRKIRHHHQWVQRRVCYPRHNY